MCAEWTFCRFLWLVKSMAKWKIKPHGAYKSHSLPHSVAFSPLRPSATFHWHWINIYESSFAVKCVHPHQTMYLLIASSTWLTSNAVVQLAARLVVAQGFICSLLFVWNTFGHWRLHRIFCTHKNPSIVHVFHGRIKAQVV